MMSPRSDRSVPILVGCWTTVCMALGVLLASMDSLPESAGVRATDGHADDVGAAIDPDGDPHRDHGDGAIRRRDGPRTRVEWRQAFRLGAFLRGNSGRGRFQDAGGERDARRYRNRLGAITAPALHAATIAIVAAFLVVAVWMWRKGVLRGVPQVTSRRTRAAIAFSLAVWLAFATLPYWG